MKKMTKDKCLNFEISTLSKYTISKTSPFGVYFEDPSHVEKYMHNFLVLKNNQYTAKDIDTYIENRKENGFVQLRIETEAETAYTHQLHGWIETQLTYLISMYPQPLPDVRSISLIKVQISDDPFFHYLYNQDVIYGVQYAEMNIKKIKYIITNHKEISWFYFKENGQIIGHLSLIVDDSTAEIDEVHIDEAYRQKGYGTQMLNQIIIQIKSLTIEQVFLVMETDNISAERLYNKFGFIASGQFRFLRKMF
jgi:ribosomal protein S18 acetylase RimI-like enzyme